MRQLARFFHLPLFIKELAERAARPRTYVLRVVYGALFYAIFVFLTREHLGVAVVNEIGSGGRMVLPLLMAPLIAVYALVPAMMCGSIADERTRGSLELLLLTSLKPWRIVLQKFLSGLVPIVSLLLLSAPLYAVAYAKGGFTSEMLIIILWLQLLAAVSVVAFTLACSAWSRSAVFAFVLTYLLGAWICLATPTCVKWTFDIFELEVAKPWLLRSRNFALFVPFVVKAELGREVVFQRIAIWSIPSIGTTLLSLLVARIGITRIVLANASFPRLFGWWTRLFRSARAWSGSPDQSPIAWRECRRFGLSSWVSVILIAVAVQIAVLAIIGTLYVVDTWWNDLNGTAPPTALAGIIFGAMTLGTILYGTNAFASERANQSLDVLLTTPVSPRAIIAQKASLIWRWQCLCFFPLVTLSYVEAWRPQWADSADSVSVFLFASVASAIVLPLAIGWVTLWLGLYFRRTRSALLIAMVALSFVVLIPFAESLNFDARHASKGGYFTVFSPAHFQIARARHELGNLFGIYTWRSVLEHFAVLGLVAGTFRWLCLNRAENMLRRS